MKFWIETAIVRLSGGSWDWPVKFSYWLNAWLIILRTNTTLWIRALTYADGITIWTWVMLFIWKQHCDRSGAGKDISRTDLPTVQGRIAADMVFFLTLEILYKTTFCFHGSQKVHRTHEYKFRRTFSLNHNSDKRYCMFPREMSSKNHTIMRVMISKHFVHT